MILDQNGQNASDGFSNDDYRRTQVLIIKICEMVHELPLEKFLDSLYNTEKKAPEESPEAWEKGRDALMRVRQQAEALQTVKNIRAGCRSVNEPAINIINAATARAWLEAV